MKATLPAAVTELFCLMEIAEEEIERAIARTRSELKRQAIHNAFTFLAPIPGMSTLDERVYRHHAKELIERCAKGMKLTDGTKAEVMILLSKLSLVAPPSAHYAALYERLFAEIFGMSVPGEAVREPWPGASEELLAHLRRKAGRSRAVRDLGEKRSSPTGVKQAAPRRRAK